MNTENGVLKVDGRRLNGHQIYQNEAEILRWNLVSFESIGQHIVDDIEIYDCLLSLKQLLSLGINPGHNRVQKLQVFRVLPQFNDFDIQCLNVVVVVPDMLVDVSLFLVLRIV